MGRTRKNEPRDRQLNLSLTGVEYESIAKRAQALGMLPAHYARTAIFHPKLSGRTKLAPPDENSPALLMQLARLGNNLNQLMRHLHQFGDPLPPDLEPLLMDIRKILARGLSK